MSALRDKALAMACQPAQRQSPQRATAAAPCDPGELGLWAQALLDPSAAAPAGLRVHNGSSPALRLAIHRNNVVLSLVQALADTCPALQALLGQARFAALAGRHVRTHPPRSPVMAEYGQDWPDWLQHHAGAAGLTTLPGAALADLARLELAQVRACHAADAPALQAADLSQYLNDASSLPNARLVLHPSVQLLQSHWPVVSCWATLQGELAGDEAQALLQQGPNTQPEAALVLRPHHAVRVVPVSPAAARVYLALLQGWPLGAAAAAGQPSTAGAWPCPPLDLGSALATLIQHGAISAWHTGAPA